MKRAVALASVALAAGCIDEPSKPPGGNNELRPSYVVDDLDGDNFDDIVLIGHDGDPREDAYVFVYWGGGVSIPEPLKLSLKTGRRDGAVWIEPTAVSVLRSSRNTAIDGLLVLTGEDPDVRPNGAVTRFNYVTEFHRSGRTYSRAGISDYRQLDSLGGYAGDLHGNNPHSTFVVGHEPAAGGNFHILVSADSLAFNIAYPLDNKPWVDASLPLEGQEYLSSISTTAPNAINQRENLYMISTTRAFLTGGDGPGYLADYSSAMPQFDRYFTRVTRSDRTIMTASTGLYGDFITLTTISIVTGTDTQLAPAIVTLDPMTKAYDAVSYNLDGDPHPDVVTIEPHEDGTTSLRAYMNLQAPTQMGASTIPLATITAADEISGWDILTVGDFLSAPGPEIIVANSANPAAGLRCFKLTLLGTALVGC